MSNLIPFPTPSLSSQIRDSEVERILTGLLSGVSLVELTGMDETEVINNRKRDARGRYRRTSRAEREALEAFIKAIVRSGVAGAVFDELGLQFTERDPSTPGPSAA